MSDANRVHEVMNTLLADAGIGGRDDLWNGLETQAIDAAVRDVPLAESEVYPYPYPSLDSFRSAITPEIARSHSETLLELADLLTLAAARAEAFVDDDHLSRALVGAEVITSTVAAELRRDCDVQLTNAWVHSMGEAPSRATIDRLFGAAVDACPRDETPRWLWGHQQVEFSTASTDNFHDGMRRDQAMSRPIRFFENWLAQDPGSPWAHAGLADALVSESWALHRAHVSPFTVRAYAARAASEYAAAQALDPHPQFLLGRAKALMLHGDDGSRLLDEAVAAEPRVASVREEASAIREGLNDFAGAAADAGAEVDAPSTLRLVPTLNEHHPTWVAADDATALALPDATRGEYGGGQLDWLGFIPDFRDDELTRVGTQCRTENEIRNLLLADDFTRASDALALTSPGDDEASFGCTDADEVLTGIVEIERYGSSALASYDQAQNFWRYGDNLDRAARIATNWWTTEAWPGAQQRLGEIRYLQGDYAAAERAFSIAAESSEANSDTGDWTWSDAVESELMQGLAQEKRGDEEEALRSYQDVVDAGIAETEDGTPSSSSQSVFTSAQARIGAVLMSQGSTSKALPHLRMAALTAREHDRQMIERTGFDLLDTSFPMSSGADYNNYAVALLDDDAKSNAKTATIYARLAQPLDRESSVFADTLAQSQNALGDKPQAQRGYRAATARDETSYQSLNNQAVLIARHGDYRAAQQLLYRALIARSDYALGWFNLGVVLSHSWSPSQLLEAQGAFARAVRENHGLRKAPATLTPDYSAIKTNLDVSRPVSARWTLASSASSPVAGISLVAVILAIIRLIWSLGLDKVIEVTGAKVFSEDWHARRPWSRRWAVVSRFTPLTVAVAACTLIAVWPLLTPKSWSLSQVVTTVVVLALVLLFAAVGSTQRDPTTRRQGWIPGLAVGAATAFVGYPFVPVPVAQSGDLTWRARWAGVVLLACTSVAAFGIALVSGVPLVRVVGVITLAMLSSALLPVKPFDGAHLSRRVPEVVVSVALMAASSAVLINAV